MLFSNFYNSSVFQDISFELVFNDGSIQSFPSMNPFTWYALKEDGDKITVFEYDVLEGKSNYNLTVPRLNILSTREGFDKALAAADQLPQAKMFRWRANDVAVNASYDNGTWSLEYFDPVQRVEMRSISGTFMRTGARLSSLNINVTEGKAVAEN